jgi:hypothetical protein
MSIVFPPSTGAAAAAASAAALVAQGARDTAVQAANAVPALSVRIKAQEQLVYTGTTSSLGPTEIAAAVVDDTGKGVPFLDVAGRLIQHNGTDLERVPTVSDVATSSSAAAGVVQTALTSEVTARSALINTAGEPLVVGGSPAVAAVFNEVTRQGVPFMNAAGRAIQHNGTSLETVQTRAEVAALVASGQTPVETPVLPAYSFNETTFRSTPTYRQTLFITASYGQSNAMGRNDSGDTIISTTPVYPEHALMMGTTAQALGTVQTALNPLVETFSNGGRETALSGWVNHTIAAIDASGLPRPKFVAFTAAQSGQGIENLGRGSQGYTRFLQAVRSATDIAKAQGLVPVLPIIDIVWGESWTDNTASSAARAAAALSRLQRHVEEDVRVITKQIEPVLFLLTYTAHVHAIRTTATQHRIWEAFRLLQCHPRFRFSGPMYQYPSAAGDVIHISSLGQYHRGHQVSRGSVSEMFGLGWTHVYDDGHRWISATQFEIDFALPRNGDTVTIDTTGAVVSVTDIPGYYGVQVVDGTGSPPVITTHSVTSGGYTARTLRFTLDKAPGGFGDVIVSYATTRSAGAGEQDGPLVGARGCIRTAAGTTALDGTTDYDWCIPFIRKIGRP